MQLHFIPEDANLPLQPNCQRSVRAAVSGDPVLVREGRNLVAAWTLVNGHQNNSDSFFRLSRRPQVSPIYRQTNRQPLPDGKNHFTPWAPLGNGTAQKILGVTPTGDESRRNRVHCSASESACTASERARTSVGLFLNGGSASVSDRNSETGEPGALVPAGAGGRLGPPGANAG